MRLLKFEAFATGCSLRCVLLRSAINRIALTMPNMLATGDDEGVIKVGNVVSLLCAILIELSMPSALGPAEERRNKSVYATL